MSVSPLQPEQTRQAIEERLMVEFHQARTTYETATQQYQKAVRRALQPGKALRGSVAADPAVTLALKAQRDAFKNVSAALKAFNTFVVSDEIPGEPNGDSERTRPKTEDTDVMTDAEFEDAYLEALVCLADGERKVGTPFGTNGYRMCIVDGTALRDYEVLELWWGKEITDEIRHQRRRR